MLVAHRAVELRAVAEDAAVGGDGPVAGLLRGTVAGGRGELHGGDVVGWGLPETQPFEASMKTSGVTVLQKRLVLVALAN